jgi:hypothetical protein
MISYLHFCNFKTYFLQHKNSQLLLKQWKLFKIEGDILGGPHAARIRSFLFLFFLQLWLHYYLWSILQLCQFILPIKQTLNMSNFKKVNFLSHFKWFCKKNIQTAMWRLANGLDNSALDLSDWLIKIWHVPRRIVIVIGIIFSQVCANE